MIIAQVAGRKLVRVSREKGEKRNKQEKREKLEKRKKKAKQAKKHHKQKPGQECQGRVARDMRPSHQEMMLIKTPI